MAKDDDDDDELLVPTPKRSGIASSTARKVSAPMRKVIAVTRAIGILLGGSITLIGAMGLVGLAVDGVLVRLVAALVLVVGIPAFVSDRLLKRFAGGLGMVGDAFAVVWLGIALALVAVEPVAHKLFVSEGARSALRVVVALARVGYFLGGARPVFPEERGLPSQVGPGASSSAGPTVDGGTR